MARYHAVVPHRRIALLRRVATRLPPFRGKARLLSAPLSRMGLQPVRIDDLQMELDLSDPFERMAAIGLYQPEIVEVLRSHLRPGECFADCGAHVGLIAVPLANHLGPGGLVYAFEPSAGTYSRLVRNLSWLANSQGVVQPLPLALGDTAGKANLLVSVQHGWSTMSASAAAVGTGRGRRITNLLPVDVVTIDHFFIASERRLPQALKIDVEGWEEEVLRGGRELLTMHPPRVVIVERNEQILAAMGRSWDTTARLMERFGYTATDELELDVVFRPTT